MTKPSTAQIAIDIIAASESAIATSCPYLPHTTSWTGSSSPSRTTSHAATRSADHERDS